nr:hypothetical protein [Streptomyces lunaelactis]
MEAEEFSFAESGAEGEFVQGVQPVLSGRFKKLPGLGRRERLEASRLGCGGLDVSGDIARQFVLADGVLQYGLEDGVYVRHGQR